MRLSDLLLYKFVLKVLLPVIIIVYLKVTDLCIAWIYIFKNNYCRYSIKTRCVLLVDILKLILEAADTFVYNGVEWFEEGTRALHLFNLQVP